MKYLVRLTVMLLVVISIFSSFSKAPKEDHSKNLGHPWEEYDPGYFDRFQNIQSIIAYADSRIGADKKNTLAYYNFVAQIIRKRFYHGYSYYQFSDNPLACIAGRLVWNDLSAIVLPDDIMKHPKAACSQQSIVLAEIFRRNHTNYRKISFDGHFAVEGFIESQWRFFDTDMEPKLLPNRKPIDSLLAENKLTLVYSNSGIKPDELQKILNAPKEGKTNEYLAPNASLLHKICFLLISKWFLLAAFILSFTTEFQLKILNQLFARKQRIHYSTAKLFN